MSESLKALADGLNMLSSSSRATGQAPNYRAYMSMVASLQLISPLLQL